MTVADTVISAKIDGATEQKARPVLEAMGLSVSDAISILMARIADENRLPSEVKVPNAETREAMREAPESEYMYFDTVEELMAYLDADD